MAPEPASAKHRPFLFTGLLAVGLACLGGYWGCSRTSTVPPLEQGPLPAAGGRVAGLELGGASGHRFSVEIAAGAALRLEADQRDVDLEIHLRRVAGPPLLVVDTPIGRGAPERVCFVAGESGVYLVDITPFGGAGTYALQVTGPRAATSEDQACAEALGRYLATRAAGSEDLQDLARELEQVALLFSTAGETFLAAMSWREAASAWLEAGAAERAVEGQQRARTLAQRAHSRYLETSVLNRLGLAHRDLGDFERAADAFDTARRIAIDSGDRRGLASALTNLGRLGPDIGDPHAALDSLREALEIWRSLGDRGEQAQTMINRAAALGTLDRHEEAGDALAEALTLARSAGDGDRVASALFATGWNHYLRGEPAAGLGPLGEALEIFRRRGQRNDEAAALDRIGTLRAAAGDADGAVGAYREALELLEEFSNPREVATTAANLGCVLTDQEELEEAEPLLTDLQPFGARVVDPKAAAHLEFCRSKLQRQRADLPRAIAHIDTALEIVGRLREKARNEGHVYLPIWVWQSYADLAVDLRLDLFATTGDEGALAEAFETYDRSRAWSLFEQVVERRRGAPAAADSLEARNDTLQRQLNLLAETRRQLRSREPESQRLGEVEADLRRVALELEDARAAIRAAARRAGRLGTPRWVSAREVQDQLPEGCALLAWRLGSKRSHLFVLTGESITVWPLPSRKVLERYAESLYHNLQSSYLDGEQWKLVAESFAENLLPQQAVPDGVGRLLLMPDGLLHYVPFAVLASPRRNFEIGPETAILLDDFELGYLPSASVFLALETRRLQRLPAPRAAAVFADPVFTLNDGRFAKESLARPGAGEKPAPRDADSQGQARGIVARQLPDGPLPRLPFTLDEAGVLERLITADQRTVWTGFAATKEAVSRGDLGDYRMLHFATHAWIDERLPELSGLVLSQYDASGYPVDGWLHLHEIQDLDLRADLTVLSGCQTALGKHVRGNGLLGLTHGFFDAGSAQVLVSLWSVDDEAASLLMTRFYEGLLSEGLDPAAALRQAQQQLRRQPGFEAPYYWAEFALHGAS